MGIRENIVGSANGQVGGVAALDHHKAQVTILVECSWVAHFVVQNGTSEPQKMVARICEGMGILYWGTSYR